jgi:APA family basic amino acid/polyamine antiporter
LPKRNPAIARHVRVFSARRIQVPLAFLGAVVLGGFLVVHTWRDLTTAAGVWYLRSTPMWLAVMAIGSAIYLREKRRLIQRGVDVGAVFATLPPE